MADFLGRCYVEGVILEAQQTDDKKYTRGTLGVGHQSYRFNWPGTYGEGEVIKGEAIFSLGKFGGVEITIWKQVEEKKG